MIVDNVVKLDLQHRMLFHVIQFHHRPIMVY